MLNTCILHPQNMQLERNAQGCALMLDTHLGSLICTTLNCAVSQATAQVLHQLHLLLELPKLMLQSCHSAAQFRNLPPKKAHLLRRSVVPG